MHKYKFLILIAMIIIYPINVLAMSDSFKKIKTDRAVMFLHLEQYEDALKEVIPLYKEHPSEDYLEIIATSTFELGFYERAKNFFKLMLEKSPQHVDALYYLGLSFYHLNRLDDSKKLLEETIKEARFTSGSQYYLGMISQQAGERLKAVEYFTKASEDPKYSAKAKYRAAVAVNEESIEDPKLLPISRELFRETIILAKEEDASLKASAQGYLVAIDNQQKLKANESKTTVTASVGSAFNALPGYPGYPLLPLATYIPFKTTWDLNADINLDYFFRPDIIASYSLFHQTELNFNDLDWQKHELGIAYKTEKSVYGIQGHVAFTDMSNISFLSQRTTLWGEWAIGEIDKSNSTLMFPISAFILNEDALIGNQPLGNGLLIHPRFSLEFDADGHKLSTIFLGRGFIANKDNLFVDGGGMLAYESPKYGLMSLKGESGMLLRYFTNSSRDKELDSWANGALSLKLIKWLGVNVGVEWRRRYASIDSEKFDKLAFMVNLFVNPLKITQENYEKPNSPQ